MGANNGAVLIHILDKIDYERRFDIEDPDLESIWIKIRFENFKPFVFCSV